jgi:hypothetical protein
VQIKVLNGLVSETDEQRLRGDLGDEDYATQAGERGDDWPSGLTREGVLDEGDQAGAGEAAGQPDGDRQGDRPAGRAQQKAE